MKNTNPIDEIVELNDYEIERLFSHIENHYFKITNKEATKYVVEMAIIRLTDDMKDGFEAMIKAGLHEMADRTDKRHEFLASFAKAIVLINNELIEEHPTYWKDYKVYMIKTFSDMSQQIFTQIFKSLKDE